MKTYIGTKIIQAEKMSEGAFFTKKGESFPANQPDREGYEVVYAGGYVSWSPVDVFENAYREVSEDEKSLL